MNSYNLAEAVGVFLDGIAGEVSESTREWYGRCLESLVAHLGAETDLASITVRDLRSYRADLLPRMSVHSVHGRQRAMRRLYSWLLKEGIVERNIAKDVPMVRVPPEPPKALADDDLLRLLERLPAETVRDRAIILFLIETGCRVGGLCSLSLSSLDLPNHRATVVEKGNRARFVYFGEMTTEALMLWRDVRPEVETDALFVTNIGKPLQVNGVRMILQRIGKRAGVKGRINAHSFRHAFARSFLRNGGNLAVLGRLLGHSPGSPVTARFYAVFDDRELQEFHERYSPLADVRARDR